MRTRRRLGWKGLWLVLFAVAFGTNVPTPLLLLYRSSMDLSTTTVTAIFGVYAAGLLPALFVAGPASDRLGRKAVAVPFVLVSALASLLFLTADSVPLLFAGRFLQGAVSGVVFSVGSAWLTELTGVGAAGLAARRATAALSAGWALGPLSAGLLGQWAPAPTITPYLLHLTLMVPALYAAWLLPETLLERRADRPLLNLGIPPGAGRAFGWFVVPSAVFVFALPSVSVTVLPLFLQRTMTGFDVAVTGVIAGLTMLTGVLVQPWSKRLGAAVAAPVGGALGAGSLALSLVADAASAWVLLIPVAILLGAGYGLCLAAGLTATEQLATPEARGALTSSFYAIAYAGFAVPWLLSAAAREGGFATPLGITALIGAALTVVLAVGPGRRALATHVSAEPEAVPVL